MRIPTTGIVIVSGVPGSGKTYYAVQEMVRLCLRYKRPTYTNVPIRISRFRAFLYLRSGDRKIANLIRPLTKDHFLRFMKRLSAVDAAAEAFREEMGGDREVTGKVAEFLDREARQKAMAHVVELQGSAKVTGQGADWIPAGSALVLDELHKWFPNERIGGKGGEPQAVLNYTSMHRHMLHRVYVLSQRAMNVSLSWRAMAVEYCQVSNWARKLTLGPIRFPWPIMSYLFWDSVDCPNGEPQPGARPNWRELQFPALLGRHVFRLYQSFSHAGTVEELMNEAQRTQRAMMGETEPEPEGETMQTRSTTKDRFFARMGKWSAICLACFATFGLGRCSVPRADEASADAPQAVASTDGVEHKASRPRPPELGQLRGVARGQVMIDGDTIKLGETYHGATLLAVHARNGMSVWDLGGGILAEWNIGARPRVLGRLSGVPSTGADAKGSDPDNEPAEPAGPGDSGSER